MTLYLNYRYGNTRETTHEYEPGTLRSKAVKEAREANKHLTEGEYYVSIRPCKNWKEQES
ncbi:hypothetical protein [Nodosilinea nodulosa]|uniref:hypothetical protein n=1 Tax=Nodosilinea nodulosa TaxID=416001 RepID=UPI0002DD068B|nr:hypothetical protein [Nodosilinea nodulosa]